MKWLTKPGARRGVKTSEFLVLVLAVGANVALAAAHMITSGTAVKWGTLAAIAYKVSRGIVKAGGNTEDPISRP